LGRNKKVRKGEGKENKIGFSDADINMIKVHNTKNCMEWNFEGKVSDILCKPLFCI